MLNDREIVTKVMSEMGEIFKNQKLKPIYELKEYYDPRRMLLQKEIEAYRKKYRTSIKELEVMHFKLSESVFMLLKGYGDLNDRANMALLKLAQKSETEINCFRIDNFANSRISYHILVIGNCDIFKLSNLLNTHVYNLKYFKELSPDCIIVDPAYGFICDPEAFPSLCFPHEGKSIPILSLYNVATRVSQYKNYNSKAHEIVIHSVGQSELISTYIKHKEKVAEHLKEQKQVLISIKELFKKYDLDNISYDYENLKDLLTKIKKKSASGFALDMAIKNHFALLDTVAQNTLDLITKNKPNPKKNNSFYLMNQFNKRFKEFKNKMAKDFSDSTIMNLVEIYLENKEAIVLSYNVLEEQIALHNASIIKEEKKPETIEKDFSNELYILKTRFNDKYKEYAEKVKKLNKSSAGKFDFKKDDWYDIAGKILRAKPIKEDLDFIEKQIEELNVQNKKIDEKQKAVTLLFKPRPVKEKKVHQQRTKPPAKKKSCKLKKTKPIPKIKTEFIREKENDDKEIKLSQLTSSPRLFKPVKIDFPSDSEDKKSILVTSEVKDLTSSLVTDTKKLSSPPKSPDHFFIDTPKLPPQNSYGLLLECEYNKILHTFANRVVSRLNIHINDKEFKVQLNNKELKVQPHITLIVIDDDKFNDSNLLNGIAKDFEHICSHMQLPSTIKICGIHSFGEMHNFLGLSLEENDALRSIYQAFCELLKNKYGIDIRVKYEFKPHITIGYSKEGITPEKIAKLNDLLPLMPAFIVLDQIILTRKQGIGYYSPVQRLYSFELNKTINPELTSTLRLIRN